MSVRDYIHPGWADGARRIRQIFREISDSQGPVGVESHELWCGGEAIMQDGRCAACNAMRVPPVVRVHNPWLEPRKAIEAAKPDYYKNVLTQQHQIHDELHQKMEVQRRELDRVRRESDRLYERTRQGRVVSCIRCGRQTTNESGLCHTCKKQRTEKFEPHVSLLLGNGRVMSHGMSPAPSDAVMKSCPKCSAIYYQTECPVCQLMGRS